MKTLYMGHVVGELNYINPAYEIGTNKRAWRKYSGFKVSSCVGRVEMAATSIKLQPGEIRKIKIVLESK